MIQLGMGITTGVFGLQVTHFSRLLVKKTFIVTGVCAPSFLWSVYHSYPLPIYRLGMVVAPCVI